jgi:pimeloyl-ACP methyl ester carboxylesterase
MGLLTQVIVSVTLAVLFMPIVWILTPVTLDESNFAKLSNNKELYSITKQRKISVNGVTLNVNEAGPEGAKKMILFIHGFPETGLLNWKHQIPYFAKLGYRVIAPDQRGYNTSTRDADYFVSNHINSAKDMVALIKYYNYSKAYVVGHDWGGAVSWNVAITHPEVVEKHVAINLPHPQAMQDNMSLAQLRKSWYIFFFQVNGIAEYKVSSNNFAMLINMGFGTSNKGSYSLDELELYREAWSREGAITSMMNFYRYTLRQRPRLNDTLVRVPTLVLWGEQDVYLMVDMAEASVKKQYCVDCKLQLFKDASHWLPSDKGDEVNKAIHKFITGENP